MSDIRIYADVQFFGYQEQGLLDTGASISCTGSNIAKKSFHSGNTLKEFPVV